MPRFVKNPILAVAVLLLAGAAIAWRWHFNHSNSVSFTTAAVKRGDLSATIGATGTLEPLETVDVGAQVAGRISEFGKDAEGKSVDYGSVVQQGALLAKIDD